LNAWKGTPPKEGETEGDAVFERSRGEAERLLARIRDGERSQEEEAVLVKRIHAARYGGKVGRVRIDELASRWDALPHKADLTEARKARVHSVLSRFGKFMEDTFPNVKEAGALTAEHFKAFLADVDASGVSARSWNDYLGILRGVLGKVDGQSQGFREYLANLPKRTENTIHRRPFGGGELDAIFAAAAVTDAELHPVLVAAACTALRRGDVCRLRWDAVDLAEGFVTVKTSKTGETVEIPIFPPFRAVLEAAAAKRRQGVPYVFPKIALAYQTNPDGLNWRLGKVLEAAGFSKPERDGEGGGKYPAPPSPGDAVEMVDAGMRRERWTDKRRTLGLGILKRHLEGETGKAIADALKIGRATVSDYLHAMEEAGRVALVSPPKVETDAARTTLAEVRDGEQRKQRGSLCGWHSFRTTFCTLALANGVPMEILRKITGHRTAEIVLKHYDRRGREAMRKAFGNAMPKAIAGTVEERKADAEFVALPPGLAELLNGATPGQLAQVEKLLADTGTAKKASRKRIGGNRK
jgi:integrase